MMVINTLPGASSKCSCSNTAKYRVNISRNYFTICGKCLDELVNGLQEVRNLNDETRNKSYKRDRYKSNFKIWTFEDDEILKSDLTAREISEKLGRTLASVRKRAKKLEIKLNY